jgi:hypothetical protein
VVLYRRIEDRKSVDMALGAYQVVKRGEFRLWELVTPEFVLFPKRYLIIPGDKNVRKTESRFFYDIRNQACVEKSSEAPLLAIVVPINEKDKLPESFDVKDLEKHKNDPAFLFYLFYSWYPATERILKKINKSIVGLKGKIREVRAKK